MIDPRESTPPMAAGTVSETAAPDSGNRSTHTRRFLRGLILPALAALAMAGVAGEITAPRYESRARLWIDGRDAGAGRDSVKVLASRNFARQAIETHRLTARLAAPTASGAGVLSGTALQLAGFALPADAAPLSRETLALRSLERGLEVRQIGGGQVAIDVVSPDPQLSADVANALAATYVELRQTRGVHAAEPESPAPVSARIIANAAPATAARWPTPLISSLLAGIGTFVLVFGLQGWLRRRQGALGHEYGAIPLPETTPRPRQHLPWIGAHSGEPTSSAELTSPLRLLSREREQADLARLIELRGSAARLVTVTGGRADESIARCALALGRSLAGTEQRVVVVCLDVASPTLDGLTADPRAPGLTDLLSGVCGFSDAIHRESASRCHVIPPGRGAREADGLVTADRLPLILTALKQTYDHVIVAAPPLGGMAGAERLASLSPTTILVTQPGGMATDAVQAFDALASLGFGEIAMVTFTPEAEPRAFSRAA
ncbi:tyrosine-protein kinase family protein [Ancylobacter polymorphus]|uniref:Lipopolysaccharide biosynthesis protein n=1 Tax=Ancylobacter polymorphus TaxID=223390 RepID=A0A9E7CVZ8_9HYPH|nr:lipopolysaccharide biosynthesis protein [Ancylobacter polymorphus]UOK70254.1 lipopolysaccharide biosynthesis protein [Ancylobacter polymorphus]